MPLTKLQFRPGINRETTSYTNEGGWFDMDKVRFRFGYPEKIGGWIKQSGTTFLGTCRALHPWIALDGSNYLGVGTHLKYYINEGGGYSDITPLRVTTAAGDVTFSASDNDLNGAIDAIQTTITLTSTSGFPASGRIKIEDEIINSKKELFNLRLQRATRQSFKSHNFKHLKHKVAQLLTLETQRKQNIN